MLTIHRSERADRLVRGLAEVLAVPLEDPFVAEVVAVPSRGVERWISQSLASSLGVGASGSDGICANVVFPSPAALVAESVALACGVQPDDDPWAARRLPWSLLEVIDDSADQPWCRTLGVHIGAVGSGDLEHRRGRRVAVAQKLAGLFSAYSAQRPAMVRDWLAGDVGDLEPDLHWQPELFRRLRAHLGTPGPAERLAEAVTTLGTSPEVLDLPPRLSLFGPTRLTVDQLLALDAIAEHREVHLWLPHPSPGLWSKVAPVAAGVTAGGVTRAADTTADLPTHPLVSSLGRDTRELQLMLAEHTGPGAVHHLAAEVEPTSLLSQLQHDLHRDALPSAALVLADGDRSVQVHSCHGRLRQVEVMRELVLGLLEDDPTLELRDIVVMCPDIECFAPLISATFGLVPDEQWSGEPTKGHPAHLLTVRLADRSLRQTNPVLSVLARLLDFADSRVTASEVLDLAALPPVVRRFRFKDDELEQVGDWVRRAGVRWGLDASARAPYHLEGVPQGTWRAGLDRLLVGVAMDEDDLRTFSGVLPLDDVDSGDIDLAGRVAELVARIETTVSELSGRQPLVRWVEILERAVEDLTEVSPIDGWQVSQARAALSSAVQAAGGRADTVDLGLADVRSVLSSLLEGRPTRANFRTGHLTMCSMVPMRSVPHRVVVLLGLDDLAFPRQAHADGDNVLARRPLVGERDARTEDRQLFLDAILSAQEHLVVLYSGHDERTNAVRPPAVPLGELLDVLDRTASVPDGKVRDRVLVQHPLQPFDPRNFTAAAPFSFDPAAASGARALVADRAPRPEFLAAPLVAEPVTAIGLDDLTAFLEHPVKAFLRQRLGLAFPSDNQVGDDALAVDLVGLAGWQVGDRLLKAGLAGEDLAVATLAELARGDLPPGPLGTVAVEPIRAGVEALVAKSASLRAGEPANVDVDITLPSGLRVLGTVAGVYDDRVVRITYSRLKPKHQLVGWLHALALTAHDPTRPWRSMVAGRSDKDSDKGIAYSHVADVPPDVAIAELDSIAGLYLLGMREPLPLTEQASSTYAERRALGAPVDDAVQRASATWADRFGERADAPHRLVWEEADLAVLLAQPCDPAEARPDCVEPTRFGTLARRLWQPLIDLAARGES